MFSNITTCLNLGKVVVHYCYRLPFSNYHLKVTDDGALMTTFFESEWFWVSTISVLAVPTRPPLMKAGPSEEGPHLASIPSWVPFTGKTLGPV